MAEKDFLDLDLEEFCIVCGNLLTEEEIIDGGDICEDCDYLLGDDDDE